jgi:phospholipase C
VPNEQGLGAYRKTPVPYVPTIMDRLDGAGLTWRFYTGNGTTGTHSGYIWAICPTFAECLNSSQADNMHPEDQVLQDAAAGNLPNFSIVLPNSATGQTSQHNGTSMAIGDNYIGQVVSAIENGPDWDSTAIFITYDDCGCFYDHVPPPSGDGIRVPMVIVSPFAKPGFTDSNVATFASMLAFTEHNFGLSPLTSADGSAYDYSDAFNFSQAPRGGVRMVHGKVPQWELRWIAKQPPDDDPT